MQVEDACGRCQVPPLLLQPLVENAVKHGIATMVESGTIRVNTASAGLSNVRNRLETSFGSAAQLRTQVTTQADYNFVGATRTAH
jgi:LytS/YehU family sensor histidine kinase